MKSKPEQLLQRDYPIGIAVERREAGSERYAAFLIDFPGCVAQAETRDRARERLEAFKPRFFAKLMDLGVTIPDPTDAPAIIPGAVGFYDPATGFNVSAGRKEVTARVDARDMQVQLLQSA